MFTPRTALGLRHAIVVASAPDAMKPRMREIAAQACHRAYDENQSLSERDALDHYLDSEDFYYEA